MSKLNKVFDSLSKKLPNGYDTVLCNPRNGSPVTFLKLRGLVAAKSPTEPMTDFCNVHGLTSETSKALVGGIATIFPELFIRGCPVRKLLTAETTRAEDLIELRRNAGKIEDVGEAFEAFLRSIVEMTGLNWSDDFLKLVKRRDGSTVSVSDYSEVIKANSGKTVSEVRKIADVQHPIIPHFEHIANAKGYFGKGARIGRVKSDLAKLGADGIGSLFASLDLEESEDLEIS